MLFIGPWITRLVIEHRSPLFQDSIRFWVLLLLGYVLGALAIKCIIIPLSTHHPYWQQPCFRL